MEKRIENAMKKLNINRKGAYTVRELENIARESKCDMLYVMMYLRYGEVF